jgi:stearoyl-CoA desaturase (delta-9 desaturase)
MLNLSKILRPTHHKVKNLQWVMHLAIIPAIIYGSWPLVALMMVTFYLMHGLGSGIGAHRYYTHKTFQTSRLWQILMSFFFTISCTGSTVGYVLMHRKHHANSDKENDPHSPAAGFWRTWFGMYDESKLTFGSKAYLKMMKDPVNAFFHNYYFGIIGVYASALLLIDPILVVFMLMLPAVMQFHVNAILIALVHTPAIEKIGGYRAHETNDDSYNLPWLKPLLLGEELHNNHHTKPNSVTMNLENNWWEFDPLYYVIQTIRTDKNDSKSVSP